MGPTVHDDLLSGWPAQLCAISLLCVCVCVCFPKEILKIRPRLDPQEAMSLGMTSGNARTEAEIAGLRSSSPAAALSCYCGVSLRRSR